MNRHIYSIAGLIIILTGVSVGSTKFKSQPPASQNVLITNDVAHTVPVSLAAGTNVGINGTPTVMVAGTPTFNIGSGQTVGISGTPSVSIANTPNVNIATSVDAPVHIHDIAQSESNRVAATYSITIPSGIGGKESDIYEVPAGKVLVVTDISVNVGLPGSQVLNQAILSGKSAGNLMEVFIPITQVTHMSTTTQNVGSMTGCSYVFEEGSISVFISHDSTTPSVGGDISINGYLEDAN